MNKIDIDYIDNIINEIGRDKKNIIDILHKIQEKYNYLPEDLLKRVTEVTDLTPSDIMGVSSFYTQFRFKPAGRHSIKVCIGTACHVKGADKVFDEFKTYLNIDENNDTDKDMLFTVEKVACLGCCMLAPAVQIDDIIYGFLDANKVSDVLCDFLNEVSHKDNIKGKKYTPEKYDAEIRLCTCTSCRAAGSKKIFDIIEAEIKRSGLNIKLKNVGCNGISYLAPFVEIYFNEDKKYRYGRVTEDNVIRIITKHFKPKNIFKKINNKINSLLLKLYSDEYKEPVTRYLVDNTDPAFSMYQCRQKKIVLENCGDLDPLNIEEYIEYGGFDGLKKVINEKNKKNILNGIEKSMLRGRGGGGFLTAKKWDDVYNAENSVKYIVCNGDEGDPGAFMDRMILESFPYRVIEGIIIGAYTLNVDTGFIYIRNEYPLAINNVKKAIDICMKKNLLGDNILGSDFSFNIKIIKGAGAFVCGEETALISSIEGKRGIPIMRPPYPSQDGLWGKPTLVNNVETFSNIPWIIKNGVESFSLIGTEKSKGTKTFALAGKIKHGGLIEVPMGMTIKEIVEEIGSGIQNDKKFKAVQIGGPSGGCIPAWLSSLPIDFDELTSSGAMMGSGGLVVLDETDCMVDIARYFMSFTQNESCGKCTYCRIGTKLMLDILERLCSGNGRQNDIEDLEYLSRLVKERSICGLGKTAPNPVLSTIVHFRNEYEAHINGKCPAGKCRELINYSINDNCIGCTKCAQNCPVDAIISVPYEKHIIDIDKCTKCGTCKSVCPNGAVIVD